MGLQRIKLKMKFWGTNSWGIFVIGGSILCTFWSESAGAWRNYFWGGGGDQFVCTTHGVVFHAIILCIGMEKMATALNVRKNLIIVLQL